MHTARIAHLAERRTRCCLLPAAAVLQCVAMSTAQKVSDLPASLQKIVGAFQMVRLACQHNLHHACMHVLPQPQPQSQAGIMHPVIVRCA
jgi:hypothetical protein